MTGAPSDWLNHYGDATPVIDPESHMRELAGRGGGDAQALCPALVMGGFIDPMVAPIADATGAVESDLKPNLRIGNLDGHRVGVADVPVGAAHATTLMEELIGLGARIFLIAGATGALKPGSTSATMSSLPAACAKRVRRITTNRRTTRPAPTGRLHAR